MNLRNIYLLLSIILLLSPGCGKEPVFTEMSSNRLKIVIKGTFENEGSSNFTAMPSDANSSVIQDDSVQVIGSGSNDIVPTKIMIDIAEIRLGGKKISNYRHIIEATLSDSDPFFNGTGIVLKTDDPGDGNYDSVQLYIRKMIFDNAMVYATTDTGLVYEEPSEVYFKEEKVNGFDFNQLMVNSYWDSLRKESSEVIRVFPVEISIVGGMAYARDNDETVLEIRLVIKNFVKKYEYEYYDDGVYKICHYYALSDWLRDVRAGETDIGRNLHAVARSYVPGKTGEITVNSSGGYIVAIPASEDITRYGINVTSDSNSDSSYNGKDLREDVGSSDLPSAPTYTGSYIEPLLDYYLKYENYKYTWQEHVTSTGLTLDIYSTAWDTYETAVHGDPADEYKYGLKIPPYAGYGTSVTFSNMAPGTYKFYRLNPPSYGELFLTSAFTSGFLGEQSIQAGDDLSVTY